jgi:hypothetical protein
MSRDYRDGLVNRIDRLIENERKRSIAGPLIGLIVWLVAWGLAYMYLNTLHWLLFTFGGLVAYLSVSIGDFIERA